MIAVAGKLGKNKEPPGEKVWIKAVSAYVDWQAVHARPLGPEDGESKGLYWVDPKVFLADMPVRGAMLGIVSDWVAGRRNVVAKTSPGRHAAS